jgi:hypothetical protein
MSISLKRFWKTFIAVSIAISALAIYQTQVQTQAFLKMRTRYKWAVVMGIFAINILIGVYLFLRREQAESLWAKLEFKPTSAGWKLLGVLLLVIAFPLLWYAKFDFFGKALPDFFPLLWVFWWLALVQAFGLRLTTRLSWLDSFAFALLLDGLVFQVYTIFQPVSAYPFSLGWSEASRYYYGSLPFSESVYGAKLPLSPLHATRYFLQSIPFLFGNLPLWASRLWQALLWVGLSSLTAFALVRRIRPADTAVKLLLGGWFFLFLFQGAVYYHLQVCVIIILLGVSSRHPWRSLIAVLAASFWAGMSRLNWYPVPAMLAIGLYLLEEPYSRTNHFWRYISKPALWTVIGLATAAAGQAFYISISGNSDLAAFGSSLTSDLLWYRLLPSDTYPLGVIPGIVIASLPLLSLLFLTSRGRPLNLHWLRLWGLASMLVVLLLGGLVVSTKIGGGGDLHNMDAYLVLLGLVGAYALNQRVETEAGQRSALDARAWPLFVALLIVPVAFALSRFAPPIRYDHEQANLDLATLRETVTSYSQDGEVLFIYERHLLTFGMIPNVPLAADYEVILLTEMAISDNQLYLEKFRGDMENHRFAAIVAHRQNFEVSSGDFAEENSAWNEQVAYYLMCEYEPVRTIESSNIQVFAPRAVSECPDIIQP